MPLQKDAALVYRYGDVIIVPYPTEDTLVRGFLRFKDEGTLDQIFHEGVPTMQWVLSEFVVRQQAILACFVVDESSGIVQYLHAGFCWFNKRVKIGELDLYKAEVGIGFFKQFWRRKWTLTMAHLACEWAMDNLNVAGLYGTTPTLNRPAVAFFKALRWEHYGPLEAFTCYPVNGEHQLCGAWVSSMTKGRWVEIRNTIFE